MADPLYFATVKLPLTDKPETDWQPATQATYTDIFNIQNTLRILITHLVEEAPNDGKRYVRQNGKWVELV